MAEKKTNVSPGVKSVTLGDVRAVEAQAGVKSVASASTNDEDDKAAKDADDAAKQLDKDQKEEAKQAKQLDSEAKKLDQKVKSR